MLVATASLLAAVERDIQSGIDTALENERTHIGSARSLRELSQKTYADMLERWIRTESERTERAKQVLRDLENLRGTAESFANLVPLNQIEAEARSTLLTALALFSNRVQKALIVEDGPAAIAEIHEYTGAIQEGTRQVLTIDSAAGRQGDTQMVVLRRKSASAITGLFLIGAGACLHAFFWWLQKRRADRRYQAAESARVEQEHASRVRAQFYAHLSHELRTPLITIQNLTVQLHEPSVVHTAKQIRQAADELLHGINNVLDSSKLEAGRTELRREPVDIEHVIRRSVHRCLGLVGTKQVAVEMHVEQGLPEIVADVVKLHQIVTNLVANAIKFTDQGVVRVQVTRTGDEALLLEVTDTGIGISGEATSRIWKPFEQADETISSRFGGTGLGLSLVKALVELHDGKVGVTSTPGEGTCFWVTIPISREATAA
jgi:signal transduction histidine kinase